MRPGKGGPICIGHQPMEYMGGLEMPIVDSILPPEVTPAMLAIMGDIGINYCIDRIPKTTPPVLSQLKLAGLHHYLAHNGEFSYQHSMELAAFTDKVVQNEDFSRDKLHVEPGEKPFIEQVKDVFRACLVGDVVTIS